MQSCGKMVAIITATRLTITPSKTFRAKKSRKGRTSRRPALRKGSLRSPSYKHCTKSRRTLRMLTDSSWRRHPSEHVLDFSEGWLLPAGLPPTQSGFQTLSCSPSHGSPTIPDSKSVSGVARGVWAPQFLGPSSHLPEDMGPLLNPLPLQPHISLALHLCTRSLREPKLLEDMLVPHLSM